MKDNLIGENVLQPLKSRTITKYIKEKALNYHMFLKPKRSRKVKEEE